MTALNERALELAAAAIAAEMNKDDLPAGGWSELCRLSARAAIEAYHASEPDAEAVAVAAEREAIVQLLYKCPHDGGFDRELGPIGCSLDAQTEGGCVCAGLATAIRSRSQP